MVKILGIIFILFMSTSFIYSQINDSIIFGDPEILPEFRGDISTFFKDNIKYPLSALNDSLEGKVYISLIIDEEGNTTMHTVLRGIREDLDKESLRVAKLIKFKPAMNRGKPIKVKYIIPFEFKLSENGKPTKKGCR